MSSYIGDIVMHRVPDGMEGSYEDYYFPINHMQLRNILGQLLTQVDSMNLPSQSSKATKQIITKLCWEWFEDVMDNSTTSAPKAGLLPIRCLNRVDYELAAAR